MTKDHVNFESHLRDSHWSGWFGEQATQIPKLTKYASVQAG